MAQFKTAYGVYENAPTPCGCDEQPEFGYVKEKITDYDIDGKVVGSHDEIVFKKIGSHSIQELIDSYEETTDIKKIFERYQAGDTSVLTRRVGEFIDTVGCPETLLDAQLMMKNGDLLWNQLPASMKEKYGSVESFVQAAIDGKLAEDFNISDEVDKKLAEKDNEVEQLRKQLAELQKGGVDYE